MQDQPRLAIPQVSAAQSDLDVGRAPRTPVVESYQLGMYTIGQTVSPAARTKRLSWIGMYVVGSR